MSANDAIGVCYAIEARYGGSIVGIMEASSRGELSREDLHAYQEAYEMANLRLN